jgi:hypothetical protein
VVIASTSEWTARELTHELIRFNRDVSRHSLYLQLLADADRVLDGIALAREAVVTGQTVTSAELRARLGL